MQSQSTPHARSRLRRAVLAAVVLVAHGVGIALLFAVRNSSHITPEKSEPLQVILLPYAEDLRSQDRAHPLSVVAPKAFEVPLQSPSTLPNIRLPEGALADSAARTALRDYLGCHFKDGIGASAQDRERCEKMLRALPAAPEGPQKQTEDELLLARRFAHERAGLEAAIRVPCASATVLDLKCALNRVLNGSDIFMDTYATAGPGALNSNSGPTSVGIRPGGGRPKKPK